MTMRTILFICMLLSSAVVLADKTTVKPDPFGARRLALPVGVEAPVDGQDMQCFNGPEYMTIIRMGQFYGHLYDWRLTTLGEIKGYKLTIKSRDKTILGQNRIIKTLKDDREWLTLRLKQSGETIEGQASGFRYEKFVMWGVIVIETLLLGYQGVVN